MNRRAAVRWKLIGNSVCVPVFEWIGKRLLSPSEVQCTVSGIKSRDDSWPDAAFSEGGRVWCVDASKFPISHACPPILGFLKFEMKLLSYRAGKGFLERARRSRLRMAAKFLAELRDRLQRALPRHRPIIDAGKTAVCLCLFVCFSSNRVLADFIRSCKVGG